MAGDSPASCLGSEEQDQALGFWSVRPVFLLVIALVSLGSLLYSGWRWLTPNIAVLCLHGIEDEDPRMAAWNLSRSRFQAVLSLISRSSREPIALRQLPTFLESRSPQWSGPGKLLLTFDDGRQSDLEIVVPACTQSAIPAVFFIPSHPRIRRLSQVEILEIHSRGFEIGSHSQLHSLFLLSPGEEGEEFQKRLFEEAEGSRRVLGGILGAPPRAFAYPSGDAPPEARDAVERAGYDYAFTTEYGYAEPSSDPLRLPRFMLSADTSLDQIEEFLEGPRRVLRKQILLSLVCLLASILGWGLRSRARWTLSA